MAERKSRKEKSDSLDSIIALKDWEICAGDWNKEKQEHEIHIVVKKGDDVSGLSVKWLEILKIEKVI